jgi:hypothetical protein
MGRIALPKGPAQAHLSGDIMPRVHDRGGWPTNEPIDQKEHQLMDWERRVDALHGVLGQKGLRTTDEMRRAIESLPVEEYESMTYYERWTAALEILLLEKGLLTREEIDHKMAQLESQEA